MLTFYASPAAEAAAVKRAAARAGCRIRSLKLEARAIGPDRLVGSIGCADGWTAAALLLALAEEDASTLGARQLSRGLRVMAPDDPTFARAVHTFVRARVRFAREEGEIFQSGAFTLQEGFGDCDDHFRLVYALAVAGGLNAKLAILHHGDHVPPEMRGPAHATALLCPVGSCAWAETTVAARYGEAPNDAARRLGLTHARSDIAREVVIMSASDLPPVPAGFRDRNSPEQVRLDVEALQRLGYLSPDVSCIDDAGDPVLRAAVLAFQIATGGIDRDGLIGDRQTRPALARALVASGVQGFYYPGIEGIGELSSKHSKHLSDDFFRGVRAMADRFRAEGATITADDLLLVWKAESGIKNVPNRQGYPFGGLNQMGPDQRKAAGFVGTFSDWLTLTPHAQLPFVERYYRNATGGRLGLLRDASSLYLANFTPAFMSHAAEPGFVLFRRNPAGPLPSDGEALWAPWRKAHKGDAYAANRGLDRRRDGTIQVGDLGAALQVEAAGPYWNEVRARLAAVTGSEGGKLAGAIVVLGIVGSVLGAAYASGVT